MIYMVAISSKECTFSVNNLYGVHNARTHDYFILTFVTLLYLYLVLCGHADMIMCPGVMYPIQIVNTKCALFAWYCYHEYHVINWLLYAILHVDYYIASALTSGLLQHKHYVL